MATHFERWEKDPFFPAAEEVQQSADRMESTYRKWVISKKEKSTIWNSDDIRRDLRTALGTAKWQLDDFERAVNSSYTNNNPADSAKDRHREFAVAINSQIKKVEGSLNEPAVSQGKPPLPWVLLDERECNELAVFLSGPSTSSAVRRVPGKEQQTVSCEVADRELMPECSNMSNSLEQGRVEAKEEKCSGHRRTASANADMGTLKIAVATDVPNRRPESPMRKIPSFSGFLNGMEFANHLKFSRNGYRKLKASDHNKVGCASFPHIQQLSRDITKCHEKSKSCTDGSDKCYGKRLYGLYGAIQRQLQRSQYYMQYSRSVRVVFSAIVLLCLIVLVVLQTMRGATSPLLQ
ncbi:PREDICTED: uncharacterized protein LOC109153008 isoform X2 [Ipomoea nil]|uniref:uncharacterized protein LOC109153008 isoform X2 n=1 Tax=Ipomoea nil TaxID=35883 RepID=UPI00090181B6|nr:PREDICTED: uncharacterized protein LOC109153008 isoform X2 [Ipomoea nil]